MPAILAALQAQIRKRQGAVEQRDAQGLQHHLATMGPGINRKGPESKLLPAPAAHIEHDARRQRRTPGQRTAHRSEGQRAVGQAQAGRVDGEVDGLQLPVLDHHPAAGVPGKDQPVGLCRQQYGGKVTRPDDRQVGHRHAQRKLLQYLRTQVVTPPRIDPLHALQVRGQCIDMQHAVDHAAAGAAAGTGSEIERMQVGLARRPCQRPTPMPALRGGLAPALQAECDPFCGLQAVGGAEGEFTHLHRPLRRSGGQLKAAIDAATHLPLRQLRPIGVHGGQRQRLQARAQPCRLRHLDGQLATAGEACIDTQILAGQIGSQLQRIAEQHAGRFQAAVDTAQAVIDQTQVCALQRHGIDRLRLHGEACGAQLRTASAVEAHLQLFGAQLRMGETADVDRQAARLGSATPGAGEKDGDGGRTHSRHHALSRGRRRWTGNGHHGRRRW